MYNFWYNIVSNIYFGAFSPKKLRQEKTLNYEKMTRSSQRFQVSKCPNTLKLYTLKALLSN